MGILLNLNNGVHRHIKYWQKKQCDKSFVDLLVGRKKMKINVEKTTEGLRWKLFIVELRNRVSVVPVWKRAKNRNAHVHSDLQLGSM